MVADETNDTRSTRTMAYIRAPGQSEVRWMGETSTHFLATGNTTNDEFCLVEETAKRGESVPLHRHVDDVESFYVLEGEVTFFFDAQPDFRVGASSFVHLPWRRHPRLSRIESDTARYLILTMRATANSTVLFPFQSRRTVAPPPMKSTGTKWQLQFRTTGSTTSETCQISEPRTGLRRASRQQMVVLTDWGQLDPSRVRWSERARLPRNFLRPEQPVGR